MGMMCFPDFSENEIESYCWENKYETDFIYRDSLL